MGKMKFRHFWPAPAKILAYPRKNPLLASPGKNHSDAHAYCISLSQLNAKLVPWVINAID